jgi:hypothetical protein
MLRFQKHLKYLILNRFLASLFSGLRPLIGMKLDTIMGPVQVLVA